MVRDRSGGLHGNVSSHSNTRLTLRRSLAIARTSRINLLLKDYPVLIPGLVPPRGAWRLAFGVWRLAFGVCARARARAPDFAPSSETPGGYVGQAVLESGQAE
jgi:hypothetical protein